jgi:hypothetical protein
MKRIPALLIVLVLSFATTRLYAQSASHMAAAYKLIDATGSTEARYTAMRNGYISAFAERIPAAKKQLFLKELTTFLDKCLPLTGFKETFAKMYAESNGKVSGDLTEVGYDEPAGITRTSTRVRSHYQQSAC